MFIKGSSGVASHPKLHTYEEGYLLPVLTYDELLFSQRHRGLLRQFRDLAEMSDADFDCTYGELIKNFMEFTQVLPHKANGILGSLINYGLARTSAVFQKYCQLRKSQTTPLLKFAVFSAALLKDVGRVISNQRIMQTDEAGEFQKEWNPLSGALVGQTKFYKMYPISAAYLRIEAEVTPLLARQLFSRDAFLWLSSDLSVFSDWLAALLNQEGVGSREITWALALIKREDILAILNPLDGALLDAEATPGTEHGEAFYRWLKEAIARGEIVPNAEGSGVYAVQEGALLEKKLFKQFVDFCGIPVNFTVVYVQFGNLMGIVKKGGSDYLHAAYFSPGEASAGYSTFSTGMAQKARSAHEGMIVDKELIFLNKENIAVSALKSSKTMTPNHHQRPMQTEALSVKVNPSSTQK